MTDYQIITREDAAELEALVQHAIDEGWQLHGSVSIAAYFAGKDGAHTMLAQAVVRDRPAKTVPPIKPDPTTMGKRR